MTKKTKDIFEKLFGEKPKKGYEITYTNTSCGWRAIVIQWSAKGIGFGDLAIVFENGVIYAETECMSKEFCDAVIKKACENLDKKIPIEEDKIVDGEYIQQDRDGLLSSTFLKHIYDQIDWSKSR